MAQCWDALAGQGSRAFLLHATSSQLAMSSFLHEQEHSHHWVLHCQLPPLQVHLSPHWEPA